MIRHLGAASAAVIAMAAFAPAHAAVSFVSSTAQANAVARTFMGSTQTGSGFGNNADSTSTFEPNLGVGAKASAEGSDKYGNDTAASSARELSNAYFTSTSSGYLDLTGSTTAASYVAGNTADAYSEGQNASYTFTVDTASVINLSYLLSETATGGSAYTQLYLGTTDFYTDVLYNGNLAPNTSGSMSYDLAAGTYYLNLYSQVNDYASAGSLGTAAGSHEEKVSFDIQTSAAPEPATWALMAAGVGLAGAALRRRRTAGAFAA